MNSAMIRTTVALLLFSAMPAMAQTVVDAATIDVGGTKMRLWGIDVPDAAQSCDDGAWHPRKEATTALQAFARGDKLDCFQVAMNYDEGIPEALCYALRPNGSRDDVQAFLVASGWAWAARPGTLRYVDLERMAIKLKIGVHAHQCERADRWRRRSRDPAKN